MKRFQHYLKEVSETKRKGIAHLEQMRPLDFIHLMQVLRDNYCSQLDSNVIRINEKLDGMAFRFGMNAENKMFIESSYSGPIFNNYTKEICDKYNREPTALTRSLDGLFEILKYDRNINQILRKYNTSNGIKIVTELLYNILGELNGDKIKFVRVEYDCSKLGDVATFGVFKVLDGQNNIHEQEQEVIRDLILSSQQDVKFVLNNLNVNVDLSEEVQLVEKFLDEYKNCVKILKSRKKIDRDEKKSMTSIVNKIQENVAFKILQSVNGGKFGKEFEGVIVEFPEYSFKVVTNVFLNKDLVKSLQ